VDVDSISSVCAQYLGYRTHTHTHMIDCFAGTAEMVGNEMPLSVDAYMVSIGGDCIVLTYECFLVNKFMLLVIVSHADDNIEHMILHQNW